MLPVRLVVRVLVGEDVLLHGLGYPFHLTRMQAASRTTEKAENVEELSRGQYAASGGYIAGVDRVCEDE
jgi:hypothetical protein